MKEVTLAVTCHIPDCMTTEDAINEMELAIENAKSGIQFDDVYQMPDNYFSNVTGM